MRRYPETVKAAERLNSADAAAALLRSLLELAGGVTTKQVTRLFDWDEDRTARAAQRLEGERALVRSGGMLILAGLAR